MKILLACLVFCFANLSSLFATCDCTTSTDCTEQVEGPSMILPGNEYILRHSVPGVNGAMTFIGNTLGLSKAPCLNEPGTSDGVGAFTTTNPALQVNTYPSLSSGVGSPAGTTLNWQENGSSAVLNLPAGSTVLYAELIWGASFGYYCETPQTGDGIGVDPDCVLNFADGPIYFTTADNQVHAIMSDPATRLISQNPASDTQPYYQAGNYVRSANVTSLFLADSLANPNGTYIVSGVPATVSGFDDVHNCAGWTLAIIYQNPSIEEVNNMTLFVSNQQGSYTSNPAEVSGFCAAPSIGSSARLLVSALEGDANKTGDQMLFGPTADTMVPLSGPNNPEDNFFCSQINDDAGNLIDTTGTFCGFNANAATGELYSGGRQGYDITNVDCSAIISANQTTAFARGATVGDDFTINALGIQISVYAPVIIPTLLVNGQTYIISLIGDTVTFTSAVKNTGFGAAYDVVFTDLLEQGLEFVPNSFKVNNVVVPNADLVTGVSLGNIDSQQSLSIAYQAKIISEPPSGTTFYNQVTATYDFNPCNQTAPIRSSNNSNIVAIDPPLLQLVSEPGNFVGTLKKYKFLNTTVYTLTTTWTPIPSAIAYQIYKNGKLVAEIPAAGPYLFETCVDSKADVSSFTIVAVFPNNVFSTPLKIRIIS